MTNDEAISSATLLGCEFKQEIFALWCVRVPGARYWATGYKTKGHAAKDALRTLLNPPEEVTMVKL